MPQVQLPIFPHGATEINANLAVVREGDKLTYFYGHMPVFIHEVDDIKTFRMITSQYYINGSVTQAEICNAFGVPPISVKRSVKLYREKGAAGFYEEKRRRGPAVLTPPVIDKAQQLFDEGHELSEVAEKLGLKKDTLRKAVSSGRLHMVSKKKR